MAALANVLTGAALYKSCFKSNSWSLVVFLCAF